jgi:S-layer homology domain
MTGGIPRGLLVPIVFLSMAGAADAQSTPQSPADFGDKINILQVPAASFQPRCSALTYDYLSSGYMAPTNNPCTPFADLMWATVTLPTGAEIKFLDLYYNDTDAANDVAAYIRAYNNAAGLETIASVSSDGSPGMGYASSELLSYTVNNDVQYDPQGRILTVVLSYPNANASLGFKGVDIWWIRKVSPAPAQATFNDVPTGHPFFQYIEALSKSGITGGCGTDIYCPDNPVTRGQMAVFLAKALGLSWFDQSGIK